MGYNDTTKPYVRKCETAIRVVLCCFDIHSTPETSVSNLSLTLMCVVVGGTSCPSDGRNMQEAIQHAERLAKTAERKASAQRSHFMRRVAKMGVSLTLTRTLTLTQTRYLTLNLNQTLL
jgi:hypothetical protein